MRNLIFLLFLFCSVPLFAQDYLDIDAKVLAYPAKFKSIEGLTARIETDFTSNHDRVRAIYVWITNNVQYDPAESNKISNKITFSSEREKIKKIKDKNRLQATRTLKMKAGICHGYATLFNELCHDLGIKSRLVSGYARNAVRDIGKAHANSNHAWNIVQIDGEEYLIDTTWGAGSFTNEFKQDPIDFFFKTPPEILSKIYHPQKEKDALVKNFRSRNEYINSVLLFGKTIESFQLISPLAGKLSNKSQEATRFEFNSNVPVKWVSYTLNGKIEKVAFSNNDNQIRFEIAFYKKQAGEVLIFIDGQAVAGYLLQ